MKIVQWLDDRIGIRSLLRLALDEPVPGGARWRYVFGSVLTYLFMQQVVLGILLATYYSPSASDAWASTAYLNDRVAGGWFLRGLHHHGSSAMVIVVVLHMAQVVWAGAYRAPREANWWAGLALGLMVLGFALTGYLLPWDQKGYWATQVATGIIGTVPLGEMQQQLLQGGSEYGNLTITRFYVLHVFVLPIALGSLLALHIYLFRRHGVTPPATMGPAQLERTKAPFWPNQLFRDVVAMAITGALLAWLTYRTHGAELFAPADPASAFVARPEWYFLFLFQLLKYFEGPMAIIGTVIIPGAVLVFLFALPWLDRAQSRRARERAPVLLGVATLMAGVVALTVIALKEDAANDKYQEGLEAAEAQAERARELAKLGVPAEGGVAVFTNDPEHVPRELFSAHCAACHELEGVGGGESGEGEAPTFTGYGDRAWLSGVIRDPEAARYFGGTESHDTMPAYDAESLPDPALAAVVEYLLSLRGDVVVDRALVGRGAALWEQELDCSGCHAVTPAIDGEGAPGLLGRGRVEWLARVIADSSAPELFGESATMPHFDEQLSREEIWTLAEFIDGRAAMPRVEDPPAIPRIAVVVEAPAPEPETEPKTPVADGVERDGAASEGSTPESEAPPTPEPKPRPKPKPKPKPKPEQPSADLANGKRVFLAKCKSCHGADGRGETSYGKKIGAPNLKADRPSRSEAERVIRKGTPGTKMKGYESKLSDDDIRDLVAFVRRL